MLKRRERLRKSLTDRPRLSVNAWDLDAKNATELLPNKMIATSHPAHVEDLVSVKFARMTATNHPAPAEDLVSVKFARMTATNHPAPAEDLVSVRSAKQTATSHHALAEDRDFAKPAKLPSSNTLTTWDTLPTFTHTSQDNSHQTSTSSKEESASSGIWTVPPEDSETINTDSDSEHANQPSTSNSLASTKCQEPSEPTPETTLSSQTPKEATLLEAATVLS